jgi:diacylglycerol kinase family enzyme
MTNITLLDPVQGLVDFVNDIKPYHTKIVEVLVEYVQTDKVNVTVNDDFSFHIHLGYPHFDSYFKFKILRGEFTSNGVYVQGNATFLSGNQLIYYTYLLLPEHIQ